MATVKFYTKEKSIEIRCVYVGPQKPEFFS